MHSSLSLHWLVSFIVCVYSSGQVAAIHYSLCSTHSLSWLPYTLSVCLSFFFTRLCYRIYVFTLTSLRLLVIYFRVIFLPCQHSFLFFFLCICNFHPRLCRLSWFRPLSNFSFCCFSLSLSLHPAVIVKPYPS